MFKKFWNLPTSTIILLIILCLICIVSGFYFLIKPLIPRTAEPVDYTVYIYENGEAQINVDSVGKIVQTGKDVKIGNTTYLAGTIILPGNGNEIYYDYPRRDFVNE